MPTKTFYIDQEPIIFQWGFNWNNFTITKDGEVIGQFKNEKELRKGQTILLGEDKSLSIQLKRKWGFLPELEILLNGTPLPGSSTEPQEQLKQVYYLLLFITLFNAGLGLVAEITNLDFLKGLGLGLGTVIVGLLYGMFAYLVHYKRSLLALYLAIGLMSLDLLLTFVFAAQLGGNPMSGLMMKVLFIMLLCKGVPALKKVKRDSALLAERNLDAISY